MNTTPKISIIVPVYNVEKYITECIDSILAQTHKDWELILVDDGSIDNSGKICDEYAIKDSRIKVIHKENGGLSSARNAGLDVAKGEYITFSDSDDFISFDTIEENIKIFKSNSNIDIVQYPVYYKYGSKDVYRNNIPMQIIKGEKELWEFYFKFGCYIVCDKIYKRYIFNNIRFPIGLFFEDTYIIPDIFKIANEMFISTKGCYYYRYREGSIINRPITYKYINDKIILFNKLYNETKGIEDILKYRINFLIMIINNYIYAKQILSNYNFKRLCHNNKIKYNAPLQHITYITNINSKIKFLLYKFFGIKFICNIYNIYKKLFLK